MGVSPLHRSLELLEAIRCMWSNLRLVGRWMACLLHLEQFLRWISDCDHPPNIHYVSM